MKKKALALLLTGALVLGGCSSGTEKDSSSQAPTKQAAPEVDKKPVNPSSIQDVLDGPSYYEEREVKKPKNADVSLNIVKKQISKGKSIKENIDDPNFRDAVKGTFVGASNLSKAEKQALWEYIKYLNAYETKLINKKIKELVEKLKSGKGTKEDLALLQSLLPVKPGVPLKDKGKPKPDSTDENKQEKSEQPESKDPQSSNTPSNGNQNQNGGSDEPGSATSGTPDTNHLANLPAGSGGNQAGDQNGSSSNSSTHPNQGNQSDSGQNGQTPPSNGNNNNTGEGNNSGTTTVNNGGNQLQQPGDHNNQTPGNRGSDRDEEGKGRTQTRDEPNGYNRAKAKAYAYKWWNKRNNKEYGYYSKVMGGCYDCWYDCTNFISQVIKAGGIKEVTKGNSYWYYRDLPSKPSYSWGVANSFYSHFRGRAKMVDNIWKLKIGDVISFDFENDGRIDHTAVVTKVDNFDVYVTQHTEDKKDNPISWLLLYGVKMYAYDMGTAKN
ncbi:amidase domain-containing protein [Thermoflavimicrobium dichotomicum]|uniref:Putative amidase domain-containing protein n=1 Tax=Thermoflavimicrobium dichotomicum TaxID=46223 RepID=A0A1I3JQS7_9BACL|nr:amidase domain-containing protein [Thermoflavimicrobium dichotomicum]SFI62524.1 Putative amidase domain-containing protein [Thermoflavimicrobium dichotomicum]